MKTLGSKLRKANMELQGRPLKEDGSSGSTSVFRSVDITVELWGQIFRDLHV